MEKNLRKNETIEDGYIAELEYHLRDEIDHLIAGGESEEQVFKDALAGIGEANGIATDYHKIKTRRMSGWPPCQKKRYMPELLANHFKMV